MKAIALASLVVTFVASRGVLCAQNTSGLTSDFAPPVGRAVDSPGESPGQFRLLSARSTDGLTFVPTGQIISDQANVPDLIVDKRGRVSLYYTGWDVGGRRNTTGLAISIDQGRTWVFKHVEVPGLERAGDPDIVRLDDDGTLRMFLTTRVGDNSAIVCADSRDGIHFEKRGTAFAKPGLDLLDSTTFHLDSSWHILTLQGSEARQRHGTSGDAREFEVGEIMPFVAEGEPYIAANGVEANGGYRIYGFSLPKQNFRSFFSTDGVAWTAEPGIRLSLDARSGAGGSQIKDPSVVKLGDGTYLMVYTARMPESPGDIAANPPRRDEFAQLRQQGPNPQPRRPGDGPEQPSQRARGPWDNDVVVYRVSSDGAVERVATFDRAGVPTLARLKDGRLIVAHQHFPENDQASFDKVAVHLSADEGKTWTAPEVIRVDGLPEGMRFPFDPTLVPLPDGRVRLYFTGNFGRSFDRGATPAIYSAISTDGVSYAFEPGVRFGVEGRTVIDCAVVLHGDVFHLFAPDNGAVRGPGRRPGEETPEARPLEGVGYHATSTDGLNFKRLEDVRIEGRRHWLGNAQSDGKLITFFGTGDPGPSAPGQPRGGLWMATSPDGNKWQLVKSPAIGGADPGTVTAREGGWIFAVTGPPRPGTASAGERQQPAAEGAGTQRNPGEGFRPPMPPMMAALDANRDGVIDSGELANATAALKTLDRDGDGRLTQDELRPEGRSGGARPPGEPVNRPPPSPGDR